MSPEASRHSPVETICESTVKLIPHYFLGIEKVSNCASNSLLGKMIKIGQSMSRIKFTGYRKKIRSNVLGISIVPALGLVNIPLSSLCLPIPKLKPDVRELTIPVVNIDVNADLCTEFCPTYSSPLCCFYVEKVSLSIPVMHCNTTFPTSLIYQVKQQLSLPPCN